jgi:ACS family hexuronate transporter-like MFS transporter
MRLFPYRWRIVFLLFTATSINYLDRQLIGLLKPLLEKEFAWTESDFARMVMAFTAAYALGLLLGGRWIDQLGTRLGYALSITLWSIAAILHAFARNVTSFTLFRGLLGLGESGNFPAAMKAVAEWFPKKERGLATGLFNAGTSVGVVLALLLTPLILQFGGWQDVFWITGMLGFVWLIYWWKYYNLPHQHPRLSWEEKKFLEESRAEEQEPSLTAPVQWIRLFRLPQTWAYIAGKAFIDPIYWFFLFWLPSYFSTRFELDLKKPSLPLMIIYLSTTLGSILGGYVSSYLIGKNWETLKARKAALFLFASLEVAVILAQFTVNPWAAVGLLSIAVAAHQAWASNIFTLASDLFPHQVVSSVVGIGGMAGAVGGIIFPLVVGYLLDAYKAMNQLTTGYHILFTCCGCTYLLTLAIIHLLTRGRKRVPLQALQSSGR